MKKPLLILIILVLLLLPIGSYALVDTEPPKASNNIIVPETYTVSLDPNGGLCSKDSITVNYGQAYGTMPTPTRTGYKFAGWWTTKATGGKQVTKDTVCYATGNFTLYARWTALASYTVTLNPNGGTCSTPNITVYYSKAYGTLPTPTRRGYKFAGWWTTKATGGKQVTASTVCYATGNFTVYARWTALASYTVTLNPNGGTCSQSSITVYYSQTYGTLPMPIRTCCTFAGWWTTKDIGGKQVTKDTVCYATGNFTLCARWTANIYTVSFNANGGSCTVSSNTVTYGQPYGPLPTPTQTGYIFAGWWTAEETGGERVTASTVCYATGNFTLYARWTPETYTVTLNPNNSAMSPTTMTVTYGQPYGPLPALTYTGYTFDGWWTTEETGGEQVTASTVCYATGNFSLYARSTPETYTVTLNPINADEMSPTTTMTVTYGQTYGTLPIPTREGYTFAGWWTAKTDGEQVTASTICYATGNHTLYAHWTANIYTVSFDPNGGTCTTSSKTVTYGQTYGTLPIPFRDGYVFAGWFTTQTTGGKQVFSSTICYETEDYTLYARWWKN